MSPRDRVTVSFPCVSANGKGKLVSVSCFQSQELRSTIKVVSGISDDVAEKIIGAARHSEHDSRIAQGVIALFDVQVFTGESFGLALAVADKLARYEEYVGSRKIYATGCVPIDQSGSVTAVQDFEYKLDIMLQEEVSDGIFFCPRGNLKDISEMGHDSVKHLESLGMTFVPIRHCEEILSALTEGVGPFAVGYGFAGSNESGESRAESVFPRTKVARLVGTVISIGFLGTAFAIWYSSSGGSSLVPPEATATVEVEGDGGEKSKHTEDEEGGTIQSMEIDVDRY